MSTTGQVAGYGSRRVLLITAAVLVLAGILTGCTLDYSSGAAEPSATGSVAAATVAAPSPPPAVITATIAPVAGAVVWTPAVCSWATAGLASDSEADRAAAARGLDPRFPNGTPAYYQQSAAQWDQVRYLVLDLCQVSTGVPDGAVPAICTDALAWLQAGAAAHDADLQRPGATASDHTWDQAWAAFYRSLSAFIGQGCGHD